jgi:hypothetical protein
MYLARAHFKNFRNFADFAVSFHPGLNLIVGENNIGKSNVVDGMRIALGSASLDRSSLRAQRSDLHRDASGKIATEFEITLVFRSLSKDDMATFLDLLVYDPTDSSKSTAELCYRWSWSDAAQRYSEDRCGGGAAERAIKQEVLQSLPAAYLEPLRDAQAYLSAGRGSRISTLLSKLSSDEEQKSLVTLMRETSRWSGDEKNRTVNLYGYGRDHHFRLASVGHDSRALAVQCRGASPLQGCPARWGANHRLPPAALFRTLGRMPSKLEPEPRECLRSRYLRVAHQMVDPERRLRQSSRRPGGRWDRSALHLGGNLADAQDLRLHRHGSPARAGAVAPSGG